MPPSGSSLDSSRHLSFYSWCLKCGEGPMGKGWWVGRISSLLVFLSLWFWLWLDWQSVTFQGTSYQAQRDLERMMMPFFTEEPSVSSLTQKASPWDTSSGMYLNCDGDIETGLWEMDRKSSLSILGEKRANSQVMLRTLGRWQNSQHCGPWGRLLGELGYFPEMDVRSRELNHSNSPWASEPETNCHWGLLNLYFIP